MSSRVVRPLVVIRSHPGFRSLTNPASSNGLIANVTAGREQPSCAANEARVTDS
jgi:hypothetical protein